jgi:hypothetical protein
VIRTYSVDGASGLFALLRHSFGRFKVSVNGWFCTSCLSLGTLAFMCLLRAFFRIVCLRANVSCALKHRALYLRHSHLRKRAYNVSQAHGRLLFKHKHVVWCVHVLFYDTSTTASHLHVTSRSCSCMLHSLSFIGTLVLL